MSSVMADSNNIARRGINSAHRYQRGWLKDNEIIIINYNDKLFINSTTLNYTLSPLSSIINQNIKLIIFNINGITYYIEYRTKLNYDSGLGTASSYNSKVSGNYYDSVIIRTKDSISNTLLEGILSLNTFMTINNIFISHYKTLGNITISKEYPIFPDQQPSPSNSIVYTPSIYILFFTLFFCIL